MSEVYFPINIDRPHNLLSYYDISTLFWVYVVTLMSSCSKFLLLIGRFIFIGSFDHGNVFFLYIVIRLHTKDKYVSNGLECFDVLFIIFYVMTILKVSVALIKGYK